MLKCSILYIQLRRAQGQPQQPKTKTMKINNKAVTKIVAMIILRPLTLFLASRVLMPALTFVECLSLAYLSMFMGYLLFATLSSLIVAKLFFGGKEDE